MKGEWLISSPTRPGTIYYTTELEPNKQYAIVIEEPIIETNIENEVQVGTEIKLTTSLKNTELTDKKVVDVKELIKSDTYLRSYSDLIGYINNEYGILKAEASYSPEATFTVNIISESEDNSQKNGLFQQGTDWYYFKDGKIDVTYDGIASNANGTWYIENGQVDFGKTGVLSRGSGWYLFKNGQVQKITTVAQNVNGWWYIKDGQVDFTYTGVAKNENGYWYIEDGKLNWNYTGIAMDVNGNKYSVVNGKATKKN